jgi:hypothetical protein
MPISSSTSIWGSSVSQEPASLVTSRGGALLDGVDEVDGFDLAEVAGWLVFSVDPLDSHALTAIAAAMAPAEQARALAVCTVLP